ncbi:MAG TPA: hypothetical protein VHR39_00790, partial [Propionibacteriaceae bacterium]|nr:hypothetical protein [Propionibacteriaceae bacterium]
KADPRQTGVSFDVAETIKGLTEGGDGVTQPDVGETFRSATLAKLCQPLKGTDITPDCKGGRRITPATRVLRQALDRSKMPRPERIAA